MSDGVVRRARAVGLAVLAGTALAAASGCSGHEPPPRTAQPTAPPPPPKRLAWLPVDTLEIPDVTRALNAELGHVQLAGTTAAHKAAVSMEVAQLAIECTQPTPTCYQAVGKSLGADRLLWAEVRTGQGRAPEVRIALALYDVGSAVAPRRVERTFAGAAEARAGVADLVGHAFARAPGSDTRGGETP